MGKDLNKTKTKTLDSTDAIMTQHNDHLVSSGTSSSETDHKTIAVGGADAFGSIHHRLREVFSNATVLSSPAVAKPSLQVLVKAVNGRVLDQSLIQELLKTLYVWLDGVPPSMSRPLFENHKLVNGVLVVSCANEDSVSWLINSVKEIGSIGGVVLSAATADSVPPKRKAAFTVCDPDGAKPETIFKRLRDFNEGLDTSGWVYITRLQANGPRGSTHLVAMDEASVEHIKGKGKRLYYMMQSVFFDFRGSYVPSHTFSRAKGNKKGKPGGKPSGKPKGSLPPGGSS